ncbi:MAG: DUF3299 domain-containing protein [Bryobacteraceae bacterium]|nr:DUF3299 domain-containing protein [Bryobacteraceae bacterium]
MSWRTSILLMVVVAALALLATRESPIGQGVGGTLPATGSAREGVLTVEWQTLRGLDHHTGKQSDEVKAIDGKTVRVPGYIVPLDDDSNQLTEFLLVPYMGACIHTPPPPANQMVYVKMLRGERASFALMDAVWVEGTIFVGRRSSPYGPTFYSMTARRVDAYR